ncbi:hypothetical protein JK359_37665 [Streptomyces actinomycinicus]|uniref:Uncharacterized protein n=1 Tax=Streptomyces actinomycinicus TaxID=1695166 RepID=A0A937ES75_9ACTN|nr:hypothetical protein [Streptomyces actinomycinicus]MBL1087602.1 hypothetical protein [Streptomyces actinomycinicus]
MNLTAVSTVRPVADVPAVDGLVIEDLAASAAEPFQPATCICWSEGSALGE